MSGRSLGPQMSGRKVAANFGIPYEHLRGEKKNCGERWQLAVKSSNLASRFSDEIAAIKKNSIDEHCVDVHLHFSSQNVNIKKIDISIFYVCGCVRSFVGFLPFCFNKK